MQRKDTKQGAASMFVVIFTTMLVMIIAVSFLRIILSESAKTTNESLSRSAYNSALAGVEDGKTLILKYEKCLDSGSTSSECAKIIDYFKNHHLPVGDPDCDAVQVLLYGATDDDEIQEMKLANGTGNGNNIEQAYSCVNISTGSDYLGTIENDRNYRTIPIRMADGEINNLKTITVEWYSKQNFDDNALDASFTSSISTDKFKAVYDSMSTNGFSTDHLSYRFVSGSAGIPTPPPMKLDFFQSTEAFKLSDYYVSVRGGSNEATNRFTTTFYPSSSTEAVGAPSLSKPGEVLNTYRIIDLASKESTNKPLPAYCDTSVTTGYVCSIEFQVPKPFYSDSTGTVNDWSLKRNENTMLLRLSSIYGLPEQIDFRIKLTTASGEADFEGVQYTIDSTGRANNLYRRVEARVDTADVYFPEPNYELQVGATGGDSNLEKRIKITDDCLRVDDGVIQACENGEGKAQTN